MLYFLKHTILYFDPPSDRTVLLAADGKYLVRRQVEAWKYTFGEIFWIHMT